MSVYAISGITCALGAIILVGRLNSAQPIAGYGYELNAIAAAIGVQALVGRGQCLGTMLGALLMGVLKTV